MYWVDLAIIAIIGLSVLTGLIRGFVKELIALAVWILAFWLAYHYAPSLDPWLQKYIQDKTARVVSGFIIILIGTLISGGIVNALLSFLLKRSGLSGTDRVLGMGFGFIRGVFIVALIMVVVQMTSLPYNEYEKQSKLYAQFNPLVGWISASMPDFIKKVNIFDKKEKPIKEAEHIGNTSLINLPTNLSVSLPEDYELSDG